MGKKLRADKFKDASFDESSAPLKAKRQFTYRQALTRAFYSPSLYQDVMYHWRGAGMRYLLLLSVLLCIPWTLQMVLQEQAYFKHFITPNIKQIPAIKIKNGDVIFDKRMPYIIKDKLSGKPTIIIDTTNKINALSGYQFNKYILLINKNSYSFNYSQLPPQRSYFGKNTTGTLTAKNTLSTLRTMKNITFIILYPTLVSIFFTVEFLILMLFASFAGILTQAMMRFSVGYWSALRIGCVAATPQLVFLFIFYLFHITFAYSSLLLFCLFMGYYVFALRSLKSSKKTLVTT